MFEYERGNLYGPVGILILALAAIVAIMVMATKSQ